MSLKTGLSAEAFARSFLVSKGLRWIKSNFKSRMGEIDLIMQEGEVLVFIEVRARASDRFGGAVASIGYDKRQKLINTASYYLMSHPLKDHQEIRFDVIGIEGKPPKIEWLKNAFGTDF